MRLRKAELAKRRYIIAVIMAAVKIGAHRIIFHMDTKSNRNQNMYIISRFICHHLMYTLVTVAMLSVFKPTDDEVNLSMYLN